MTNYVMSNYKISYIGINRSNNHMFRLHRGNLADEMDYFTLSSSDGVATTLTLSNMRELGNVEDIDDFKVYIGFIEEYGDKSCVDFLMRDKDISIVFECVEWDNTHEYTLFVDGEYKDTFYLDYSKSTVDTDLELEWRKAFKLNVGDMKDYMWLLSKYHSHTIVPTPKEDVYTLEVNDSIGTLMEYNLLCNGEIVDSFQIKHRSMSVLCILDDEYADHFNVKTYLDYVGLIVKLSEQGEDE